MFFEITIFMKKILFALAAAALVAVSCKKDGGDENTGNIEIENPEVEETPNYEEELRQLVNGIFNAFRNWFGR